MIGLAPKWQPVGGAEPSELASYCQRCCRAACRAAARRPRRPLPQSQQPRKRAAQSEREREAPPAQRCRGGRGARQVQRRHALLGNATRTARVELRRRPLEARLEASALHLPAEYQMLRLRRFRSRRAKTSHLRRLRAAQRKAPATVGRPPDERKRNCCPDSSSLLWPRRRPNWAATRKGRAATAAARDALRRRRPNEVQVWRRRRRRRGAADAGAREAAQTSAAEAAAPRWSAAAACRLRSIPRYFHRNHHLLRTTSRVLRVCFGLNRPFTKAAAAAPAPAAVPFGSRTTKAAAATTTTPAAAPADDHFLPPNSNRVPSWEESQTPAAREEKEEAPRIFGASSSPEPLNRFCLPH